MPSLYDMTDPQDPHSKMSEVPPTNCLSSDLHMCTMTYTCSLHIQSMKVIIQRLLPQTFIEHLLCALTVPSCGTTMATDAALLLVLLKCRMHRETQSGKHTKTCGRLTRERERSYHWSHRRVPKVPLGIRKIGQNNGICTEYVATMPSSESGKDQKVAQAEGTKQIEGQRENLEDKESWKQTLEF